MPDSMPFGKNYSHLPLKKRPVVFIEDVSVSDSELYFNLSVMPDSMPFVKNYSHLPLKKRPVVFIEDVSDELENLNNKPEDSRLKERSNSVQPPSPPSTSSEATLPPDSPPSFIYDIQTWPRSVVPSSSHSESSLSQPHQPLALMERMVGGYDVVRPVYSSIDQSSGLLSSSTNSPAPTAIAGDLPGTSRQGICRQCIDCGETYSTSFGLSEHRQFHCTSRNGPERVFNCETCTKVYTSKGALKMHINTHTLPFKCTICGKRFSRNWLLRGHVRTHTGEKPFSCTHCNRAFADRSNLRAHFQTHLDVKKYSCSSCSKTFTRMFLLKKHSNGICSGSTNLLHSEK